jgi:hypothetical protein
VWDSTVIHECPFELVEISTLNNKKHSLIDEKSIFKFYRPKANVTICGNIEAIQTTEGFYITPFEEAHRTKFQLAKMSDKIINEKLLSNLDAQSWNLLLMIANVQRVADQKLCLLYRSFMHVFTKHDDEFFTFVDYNGNEAILYTDDGKIYIPKCFDVAEVDIIDKTNNCYKDFAVKFEHKNQTMSGFLTCEGIIKETSKLVGCTNLKKTLFLKDTNRVIDKVGNQVSIADASNYVKLEFGLDHVNVSRMNFEHDLDIITGIDVIAKSTKIASFQEEQTFLHTQVDQFHETKSDFERLRDRLSNEVESLWSRLTHNSLTYLSLALVTLIIVSSCIVARKR